MGLLRLWPEADDVRIYFQGTRQSTGVTGQHGRKRRQTPGSYQLLLWAWMAADAGLLRPLGLRTLIISGLGRQVFE